MSSNLQSVIKQTSVLPEVLNLNGKRPANDSSKNPKVHLPDISSFLKELDKDDIGYVPIKKRRLEQLNQIAANSPKETSPYQNESSIQAPSSPPLTRGQWRDISYYSEIISKVDSKVTKEMDEVQKIEILTNLNKSKKAESHYAGFLLAEILVRKGKSSLEEKEAILQHLQRFIEEVEEKFNKSSKFNYYLGRAYLYQGNIFSTIEGSKSQTLEAYEKGMGLGNEKCYSGLASYYEKLTEYPLASQVWEKLIDILKGKNNEKAIATIHNRLGCCFIKMNKTNEALEQFSLAASKGDSYAKSNFTRYQKVVNQSRSTVTSAPPLRLVASPSNQQLKMAEPSKVLSNQSTFKRNDSQLIEQQKQSEEVIIPTKKFSRESEIDVYEDLKIASQCKVPEAMLQLGKFYAKGIDGKIEKNPKESLKLFLELFQKGHKDLAIDIAKLYLEEEGENSRIESTNQAIVYLKQVGPQSQEIKEILVNAYIQKAELLMKQVERTSELPNNLKETITELELQAKEGNQKAARWLGDLFFSGNAFFKQNYQTACFYLEQIKGDESSEFLYKYAKTLFEYWKSFSPEQQKINSTDYLDKAILHIDRAARFESQYKQVQGEIHFRRYQFRSFLNQKK